MNYIELDNPKQIYTIKKQNEIEQLIKSGVKSREIKLLCHYVSTDYKEELNALRVMCNKFAMMYRPFISSF